MASRNQMSQFSGQDQEHRIKGFGSDQPAPQSRELMLNFRKLTGEATAFQYSYLYHISLGSEQKELTLNFTGHQVIIAGEKLLELYNSLLGWGIQFVEETQPKDRCDKAAFVETINIIERPME